MATQTASPTISVPTLRRALQGDGLFGILSGLIVALGAAELSKWMGLESSGILVISGFGLIAYGFALFWYSSNRPLTRSFALTIIGINILWIIGSIFLLTVNPLPLTTEGRWFVLLAADMVACFAIWQFVGLRRMK